MTAEQQPAPGREWEQIPGESDLWHGRLTTFLNLGPSRTLLKAYNADRLQTGKEQATKLPGNWCAASRKYRWSTRAAAWDRRNFKAADDAHVEVVKADATARTLAALRAERRDEQETDEWSQRQMLVEKAKQMLAGPLYRSKTGDDGRTTIMPGKWSFYTVCEMLRLAHLLGRASTRMPLKVEADPADVQSFEDMFFESSGLLADALPVGTTPEMPADTHVRPEFDLTPGVKETLKPTQPPILKPPASR